MPVASARSLKVELAKPLEFEKVKFFVTVQGKHFFRRLHRVGGYGTTMCSVTRVEPLQSLADAEYDLACKHVGPAGSRQLDQMRRAKAPRVQSCGVVAARVPRSRRYALQEVGVSPRPGRIQQRCKAVSDDAELPVVMFSDWV